MAHAHDDGLIHGPELKAAVVAFRGPDALGICETTLDSFMAEFKAEQRREAA